MIGIRADANDFVATGHIMRCITIANELKKSGEEVLFITAGNDADKLLDDAGMKHIALHTDYREMESELEILCEQLQVRGIDTLLVDSYYVTYDYFKALNRVVATAYIDDNHDITVPVDLLINYSGYVYRFDYANDYSSMSGKKGGTKLLLGLKYAPLRPQFYETTASGGSGKDILLCAGGGDYHDAIIGILTEADARNVTDNYNWNVVIGNFVQSEDRIRAFADNHRTVTVHKAVTNMAELMSKCDVAITAAGTMLTECAAMKLPSVFFQVADNQRYGVDYWADGRQIFAGDIGVNREHTIKKAVSEVISLMDDRKRLDSMRNKLSLITDGKGAARIAEELTLLKRK